MIVNGPTTSSSKTSAAQSGDPAKAGVDYNSFLKLLVASMQKQDPTQPNDPAQTMSQLASFSNVEQSIKLNDNLDQLLSISNTTQATALIGKTASTLDGSISGIVQGVELQQQGMTIILGDGRRIAAADGFRVSAA